MAPPHDLTPGQLAKIERLRKNQGRYLGQTIEVQAVLREVEAAALKHGWSRDVFWEGKNVALTAYERPSAVGANVYLSAGIHGDEPAGPMAILQLMQENLWPPDLHLWICPCLNPTGFPLNSRENDLGFDLNRQYLSPKAEETAAHIAWLNARPRFDLTLCLHEDWESDGFYVYEIDLNNRLALAEAIVNSVAPVCPIDLSPVIEGREATRGMIRPSPEVMTTRPDWPEAFYLLMHKTRISCTLEAPSDFPLEVRVAALVRGVRAALDLLSKSGSAAPGSDMP